MKKIFASIVLLSGVLLLTNCKQDDATTTVADRDRQEVYNEDIIKIENFLKNNSITVTENDVKFDSVSFEAINSIWKQNDYKLESVELSNDTYKLVSGKYVKENDDVKYKVYYLVINEGGGKTVSKYDNIYSGYTGYKLDRTVFDTYPYGIWFGYPSNSTGSESISGYRQILDKVKTAAGVTINDDGSYNYDNAGRVIVFLPSGLGYFSGSSGKVNGYESLIFDISVIVNKEIDHDNDGILSKYEDANGNGNLWDDDTDGDGKPDFLDLDDDGDGFTTREEITYEVEENGQLVKKIYEFNAIPNCNNGSIKKHLDKTCH